MDNMDFLSFAEENFRLNKDAFVNKAKRVSEDNDAYVEYALEYYYELRRDADIVSPDINVESVRNQLLERSQVGLDKYGTTTERDDIDLAGWLQHLQEELLDAAVYIERIKREL